MTAGMPLLDRAILRELIAPLLVGLLALLQLLVAAQLLQLHEVVLGPAVTLADIARVTVALAPHFFVMAAPVAFMLGVQLALGRLAGDHELLALSAAGRSPLALYRIPLAAALFMALVAGALARWAEPWGLRQLRGVLNDVIKRNLGSAVVPGTFSEDLPRLTLYVERVEKGGLKGLLIEDAVSGGAPLLVLAEEGRIVDVGGESLALRLSRGELHRPEEAGASVARFEKGTFLVGVHERLWRKNRFYAADGALPSDRLEADARAADGRGDRVEAVRLRMTRARRWAVPLACLAFALLAVPLAVASSGARAFAYVVTVLAFAGFFVLGKLGVTLAEQGRLAPWPAAFLPDAAVAMVGLFMSARLLRSGVGKPG